MTPIDIILIALTAFAGILGAIKGFVRQLGTILGVVCAILTAFKWGPWTAERIHPLIERQELRDVIGPIVVFIGVYLAFLAAGRVLNRLICFAGMGWADRLSGCVFGSLSAAIPLGGLLLLLTTYIPSSRQAILSSHGATFLIHAVSRAHSILKRQLTDTGKSDVPRISRSEPADNADTASIPVPLR